MSFSERLKEARILLGYTQQQVADAMEITNSTYCGYETGKRQPDVAKIKQLASILKVSGDYLLETGFSEIKQERTPDEPDSSVWGLAVEYSRLNREYQKVVEHLITELLMIQEYSREE